MAVSEQSESRAQPHRPNGVIGVTGGLAVLSEESPTKRCWTSIENTIKEVSAHYEANWPLPRQPPACSDGCKQGMHCQQKDMPDVLNKENFKAVRAARLKKWLWAMLGIRGISR